MRADIASIATGLVQDDSARLDAATIDLAIDLAVARYSKDRPRVIVEDVASTGTAILNLPTEWVDEASAIASIEYPMGDVPPALIDSDRYTVYQSPAGYNLMLIYPPPVGETMRLTYTLPHVLTDLVDTIPPRDREPVACWAAAHLLEQLASFHAGDTDSTIGADRVDHRAGAESYAARARAARKRYFDELGLKPQRSVAAGAVVDLDLPDSRGNDRLLKRRAFR